MEANMMNNIQAIMDFSPISADMVMRESQEKVSNQFLLELQKLNDKQVNSEHLLQDLASGKTDNIHHVMLSLGDAKLSLQLMVQVRNKLLEGYQDILRMQV
jgi:flagellar hook-basal body complex protein FliE